MSACVKKRTGQGRYNTDSFRGGAPGAVGVAAGVSVRWQVVVLTMARQDAQRRPRSIGFWIKNLLGAKRLAAQACGNARAAPISAYYTTKESTRMAGTWQRWSGIGSQSRKVSAIDKRILATDPVRDHS